MISQNKNLYKYLKQINNIPPISDKEFNFLYDRLQKNDEKAKKRLIEGNLKLVLTIAFRYQNLGLSMMDLIEEGNIGLIIAVEKYKTQRGAKLSTYAVWWIKQSIRRAIDNQSALIRIPSYAIQNIRKCLHYWEELSEKGDTNPFDIEKISDKLQLTQKEVKNVMYSLKISKGVSSLDAPISEDDNLSIADMVCGSEYENNPEEILEREKNIESVNMVLEVLSDKEKKIITYRFGLDGNKGKTLAEIGSELGVSRERVRQIAESAIVKMRRYFERSQFV